MARRRFRFRSKKVNIPRVVSKVAGTVLALYAGGIVITELGQVMANTTSPFYAGLSLIGWTVGTNTLTNGSAGYFVGCGAGDTPVTVAQSNCIMATAGSGVLAVVGIIGIASIVMEFVEFRLK